MATITDTEDAEALSNLKLKGDAGVMHAALKVIFTVAPRTAQEMPVLKNVLLRARDGKLHVAAFDLQVGAKTVLENIDLLSPGKAMIEAAQLEDVLKELAGGELSIEFDDNFACTIVAESAKFKIPCQTPEDYPKIPKLKESNTITVPAASIRRMIDKTAFCAHTDRGKWAINGVLIDARDSRLRLVATDTKRLAMAEIDLPSPIAEPIYAVVPTKAMNVFAKTLPDEGDTVISVGRAMVQMQCGQTVLFARLIAGEFPAYDQAIPGKQPKKVYFPRDAMTTALRRALLLGSSKKDRVVGFSFEKGSLRIYRRSFETGDADITLDLDYSYEPVVVGFNAEYLLETLRTMDSVKVRMNMDDARAAVVMREKGEDGVRYTFLVMPLTVMPD